MTTEPTPTPPPGVEWRRSVPRSPDGRRLVAPPPPPPPRRRLADPPSWAARPATALIAPVVDPPVAEPALPTVDGPIEMVPAPDVTALVDAEPVEAAVADVARASGWRRCGATVVDLLVAALFVLPGIAVMYLGPTSEFDCPDWFGPPGRCLGPSRRTWTTSLVLLALGVVGYVVLYVRMVARGTSWGRSAFGYRIVDRDTLDPIGARRAIRRTVVAVVAALPAFAGFAWALKDPQRRTWQDLAARTRTVLGGDPDGPVDRDLDDDDLDDSDLDDSDLDDAGVAVTGRGVSDAPRPLR